MNSADKTLRNRYGDCKDHSLLLCQLLQALGMKADLALVSFAANAVDDTPSFDQFDHMIVCLHEGKEDRFIDPTDKEGDPNQRVPYGLGGRRALLLDWDRPRIVEIPSYSPGSNSLSVQRKVQLTRDGDVEADDRITYGGYFATVMRQYFKAIDPARRKTVWQSHFGGEPEIQIRELNVEGLVDRQSPVILSLKYKVVHALHTVDRRCVGRLPAPWEGAILTADRSDHRTAPLWLQLPLSVRTTISIEAPAGFAVPPADSLTAASKSGLFQCRRTAAATSNGLRLECEVSRPAGHFPASYYGDYVDQVEQARLVLMPNLVLSERDK
jgi:hypothetical protein